MNIELFCNILLILLVLLGQVPRIYVSNGDFDVWKTFIYFWLLIPIIVGIYSNDFRIISWISYFILLITNYIELPKAINKYKSNLPKNKNKRINDLKSLYQSTKNPILIGNTTLRWTQAQTRQILTGALTYAQPKEYSLHINCTNISDKTVTAVEVEVKTLNAFNEEVSSFVVSTRKQLLFGVSTECSWDLSGSFDINNATTKVKRVMFSDGTTWNNN